MVEKLKRQNEKKNTEFVDRFSVNFRFNQSKRKKQMFVNTDFFENVSYGLVLNF